MLLAEYKLDVLENLLTRAPIIIGLITLLFIVLLIGIYYQLHKIHELMKINNEIQQDIKNNLTKSNQNQDITRS